MMSWSTLSQMFANRQIINAETGDMFLDYIALLSDSLTFTRAAELEFTKAIYDARISKTPLYMKNKAGYLGRSSWSAVTEVRSKLGNLMLTTTNQMIIVDKVTRKPTSIAQSYREKHGHKFKGKQLKFDPITRPNTVPCYKTHVNWTDTDSQNHASWDSYINMTLNATSRLAKEGSVRYFRKNKLAGLHKLQLQYLGESVDGDELEVYVWEIKQTNTMISDVCKNGRIIFQGIFKFFE